MPLKPKVVLICGPRVEDRLEAFVARCLDDGVELICVFGPRCAFIEDLIDEWVVDIQRQSPRFRVIITSSHPDERLDEVIEFATDISEWPGPPEIVVL